METRIERRLAYLAIAIIGVGASMVAALINESAIAIGILLCTYAYIVVTDTYVCWLTYCGDVLVTTDTVKRTVRVASSVNLDFSDLMANETSGAMQLLSTQHQNYFLANQL